MLGLWGRVQYAMVLWSPLSNSDWRIVPPVALEGCRPPRRDRKGERSDIRNVSNVQLKILASLLDHKEESKQSQQTSQLCWERLTKATKYTQRPSCTEITCKGSFISRLFHIMASACALFLLFWNICYFISHLTSLWLHRWQLHKPHGKENSLHHLPQSCTYAIACFWRLGRCVLREVKEEMCYFADDGHDFVIPLDQILIPRAVTAGCTLQELVCLCVHRAGIHKGWRSISSYIHLWFSHTLPWYTTCHNRQVGKKTPKRSLLILYKVYRNPFTCVRCFIPLGGWILKPTSLRL